MENFNKTNFELVKFLHKPFGKYTYIQYNTINM